MDPELTLRVQILSREGEDLCVSLSLSGRERILSGDSTRVAMTVAMHVRSWLLHPPSGQGG